MKHNSILSIVIPTYNRADHLDCCLGTHIPLAKAHNIMLFVSDNASTDATAEVVARRSKEYQFIEYHCNESNLGPDENIELALKHPQSRYIWLLGDTYSIPPDGINYVLNHLAGTDAEYDLFLFNVSERINDIPQKDYNSQNDLLSNLGWHMTCMSCLVYSSKLIANADFGRYRNTNFIQTGVIFEYLANKQFLVHWAPSISISGITIKGSIKESWQNQTFEIWVKRWPNYVFSLPPSYDIGAKLKCIKDHSTKSGIFSMQGLLSLKSVNQFNFQIYRRYCDLFPITISLYRSIIFLIAILPQPIARMMKPLKKKWTNRNRSWL
ncbi:MAG: glycosyltransferase [Geobacter sp.]|nr:MAG: glycosyltransferase [Geobacter sp.]